MDLYQIANHILPTIAKQEHTLGLVFSSNDATLMKFQKEILRDEEVILISRKKMRLTESQTLIAWITQVSSIYGDEIKRNMVVTFLQCQISGVRGSK